MNNNKSIFVGKTLFCLLLAVTLLSSSPAWAQADTERIRDLERKLQDSLRLIENLTNRVNELERARAPQPQAPAKAAAAPAAAPQEARIEALERSVAQIGSAPEVKRDFGVPLHGFFDAGYERSTQQRDDGRKAGFVLGNLDFFITPSFGRVKTLAELVFEVDEGGGLATDLERLQIGYTVTDSLTAWIGRFHTPYGYWNAAFHHGAQIQTAVTRPRFIDFEDKGGILPAHSVGIWGTGEFAAGPGKVHYDAYVANGSRIVDGILDFNAHRDDNTNLAVGANIGYRFRGSLDGLLLGLHGLSEDVNVYQDGTLQGRTRLALAGAYFYLEQGAWEGIGEYYNFRNRDLSGGTGTHSSWAAFAQLGYTFADTWTPYYRWEKTELDQADLYFAAQESGRSYSRNVAGLRYNLNANTAIKFEANRTRDVIMGESRSYTEARAQFAVRF